MAATSSFLLMLNLLFKVLMSCFNRVAILVCDGNIGTAPFFPYIDVRFNFSFGVCFIFEMHLTLNLKSEIPKLRTFNIITIFKIRLVTLTMYMT